jgi:hypothetical protein
MKWIMKWALVGLFLGNVLTSCASQSKQPHRALNATLPASEQCHYNEHILFADQWFFHPYPSDLFPENPHEVLLPMMKAQLLEATNQRNLIASFIDVPSMEFSRGFITLQSGLERSLLFPPQESTQPLLPTCFILVHSQYFGARLQEVFQPASAYASQTMHWSVEFTLWNNQQRNWKVHAIAECIIDNTQPASITQCVEQLLDQMIQAGVVND